MLRAAVPLAILAGCQTLTMLTGGIDLSVGAVASMAGFVVASLVGRPGRRRAIVVALAAAALAGLVTGIGVGVFRVHPLIMTLGMGLVVLGLANVWQLVDGPDRRRRADELRTLGSGPSLEVLPYSLVVFVPVAAADPGGPPANAATAGCSTPSATTRSPRACRAPAPGRSWSSCTSSRRSLPRVAGFLSGPDERRQRLARRLVVLPSVAAAVIGGTSILGGRGGFGGTIVGALILTVLSSLLSSLGFPKPSARSSSGRSSSSSRPRTPGSPARPDGGDGPADQPPPRPRPWRHEHQMGRRRARRRRRGASSTATSVPTPQTDGPGRRRRPRLATVGADGDRPLPGRRRRSGSACPGLYDPAAGTTRFLVNFPGAWAGKPVAGPVGAALGLPAFLINDARAFGLAELRLGAGRGSLVDDRASRSGRGSAA